MSIKKMKKNSCNEFELCCILICMCGWKLNLRSHIVRTSTEFQPLKPSPKKTKGFGMAGKKPAKSFLEGNGLLMSRTFITFLLSIFVSCTDRVLIKKPFGRHTFS